MATRQRAGGRPRDGSAARSEEDARRSRAQGTVGKIIRQPANLSKRVLIVEDHSLNMKLFRVLLHSRGYEMIETKDGHAGLDLARADDPDLIIMDIQLPDISGLEIIRALKGDDRTRDIPIVAITAAMPEEETNIRAAGADASAPCCKRTTPAVDPPAVDPRLLIPRLLIDSAPQTAMMR